MTESSTAIAAEPVKQFSVFLARRAGRLSDLGALFANHQVHVMAISMVDTTDSALVRLVVDDPDRARELLAVRDFPFNETDLLAVEFTDESDLGKVLGALLEAEIDVHYCYAFLKRPAGRCALALHVDDTDFAARSLAGRGFTILTQRDISR
jgi:hypothetical protein